MKRGLLYLLQLVFCLLLISCNDVKLAKQLDGTWKSSTMQWSYDDGRKEEVVITITFSYSEERNDDGTFVEELSGIVKDVDLEVLDGSFNCNYYSRIKGRWEIIWGDLYLYYNVNTLEVDVNQNDVDLSIYNISDQLDMLSYTMGTWSDPRETLSKEAKKDIYKNLFHAYNSDSDDKAYTGLKVSGGTMSFEASDVRGRVKFERIK